jgi:hypothetical protein
VHARAVSGDHVSQPVICTARLPAIDWSQASAQEVVAATSQPPVFGRLAY